MVFVEDLVSPELGAGDAHHLGEVLRLRPGETVAVADGAGSWRTCVFTSFGTPSRRPAAGRLGTAPRFGLEVSGPVHVNQRLRPVLEVGFSWAKADRTEWAVAKLTELGVDRLTPIVADRTVVRPDPGPSLHREDRLRKIVREAAMQSRRAWLPEIGATQSLDAVLARSPAERGRARRARWRAPLARDSRRAGRS